MHTCEACGKEMQTNEQYCEECAATLAMLGQLPEKKPTETPSSTPTQKPAAKTSSEDDMKGHKPAVAALVLAIIGFVFTGLVSLVLSAIKDMVWELLNEAFAAEFNGFVATQPDEIAILNTFATGMKIGFGAIHFASGGIFMLIGFICNIVSICKYYGNKSETKVKSTIVISYIALAFLAIAIIIAAVGTSNYATIVENLMAPYIG